MIRRWFSNFIKKNINKIRDLGTKLLIVAIVVLIATIILSFNKTSDNSGTKNDDNQIYRPSETIIKGYNVSEEQYQIDYNTVNKFLNFCNNKQIQEAYDLLSDACKEELYPTIEDFKNNYYNTIFTEERVYNIQSWISEANYTVYKIRYTNNMMATGQYKSDNVYEDYVTLDKKATVEKISIGNLVISEDCNIVTRTDELEAEVIKKKKYISDEEYEINIKNNTENTILLDNLKSTRTINLIGSTGAEYNAYTNRMFINDLTINPAQTKTITIRFKKNISLNNKSKRIEFLNIVKDYDAYIKDANNYKDILKMEIKLED